MGVGAVEVGFPMPRDSLPFLPHSKFLGSTGARLGKASFSVVLVLGYQLVHELLVWASGSRDDGNEEGSDNRKV
jgi:hypothetical protein